MLEPVVGDCGATVTPALYSHQVEIINAAYGKKYFAIFADCGLGKTVCAIKLIEKYQPCKALIICPATILENWQDEVKKWSSLKSIILYGSRAKRIKLLQEEAHIYIINYEALRILEQELALKKFSLICCDESQKIKGYKTLQSKVAFRLGQKTPYKLLLTGTPIVNSYLDIYGQYRFLNPFIFGFSFYRWRTRYCVLGGYMNYQVVSFINTEELKQKIYSCAISIKKEDCLTLPDKLYQTHYIELTQEQRRIYDSLKKDFIAELNGRIVTAPYVLTRLIRFSQITAGFIKDETQQEINFNDNPKLKWLREFIEDLPKEEKVVIFFRFLKELSNLQAMFKEMKTPFVEIYGETKNRQDKIKEFNYGSTRLFLGQIETASLGINLQSAAYCVFLTNSYSYGSRFQAESRLHRIGQQRNVLYLDCLARNTIDTIILNCLKNKEELAQKILTTPNKDGIL